MTASPGESRTSRAYAAAASAGNTTTEPSLSRALLDLQRAVERYAVAEATGPYSLAWSQVAEAPPSETRKQREELQAFKKVLNSVSWQEEGRRRAATAMSWQTCSCFTGDDLRPRTSRRFEPPSRFAVDVQPMRASVAA